MVLEKRIAIIKEAFGIRTLEDWTRITPQQVLALDEVGPVTLSHCRLYLAGRGITLLDDQTPAHWAKHLGKAAICHQMTDSEDSDVLPFTILVDNLEKYPFTFEGIIRKGTRKWIVPTKHVRLPNNHGDYQVEGISDVTVERKSLEDAYSTLANRDAFREQCEEMNFSMRAAFIIIESTWFEVADPAKYIPEWRSKLNPRAVWETISSWSIDLPRVHWKAAGDRRMAELMTFSVLRNAWKKSHG